MPITFYSVLRLSNRAQDFISRNARTGIRVLAGELYFHIVRYILLSDTLTYLVPLL